MKWNAAIKIKITATAIKIAKSQFVILSTTVPAPQQITAVPGSIAAKTTNGEAKIAAEARPVNIFFKFFLPC